MTDDSEALRLSHERLIAAIRLMNETLGTADEKLQRLLDGMRRARDEPDPAADALLELTAAVERNTAQIERLIRIMTAGRLAGPSNDTTEDREL